MSIFDGFFLLATFKPVSGGIIYDVRYSGTSTQPPVIVKMMIIRRSSMTTMTRSMLSYLTKRQREKQRRARATAPPTWKVYISMFRFFFLYSIFKFFFLYSIFISSFSFCIQFYRQIFTPPAMYVVVR